MEENILVTFCVIHLFSRANYEIANLQDRVFNTVKPMPRMFACECNIEKEEYGAARGKRKRRELMAHERKCEKMRDLTYRRLFYALRYE